MSESIPRIWRRARFWWPAGLLLGLAALAGLAWAALPQDSTPVPLVIAPELAKMAVAEGAGKHMPSRIEALLARHSAASDAPPEPPTTRTASEAISRIADGQVELWIGRLDPTAPSLPAGVRALRLDWSSGPMVIMRSDTDIHDWSQLRGRTVCVPSDGRHVGRLARDFGALEQVYPVAANALVALRVGACDAAVADASLLQQLLSYPEWKKFSARLMPQDQEPLVALWSTRLAASQQRQLRRLVGKPALQQARQTLARSIAFEVYLEQEAPDCHS